MCFTGGMTNEQYDDGTNDPSADPVIHLLSLANDISGVSDNILLMAVSAQDGGLPGASALHDLRHMLFATSMLVKGMAEAWERRDRDGYTSWQHVQAACSVVASVALAEVYVDTIRDMGGDVGFSA